VLLVRWCIVVWGPGADTPVLVPLTTALYVHGTVNKCKSVMVDIGTGYYAEKDTDAGSTPFLIARVYFCVCV
jgi:prefoldin alpha subunit